MTCTAQQRLTPALNLYTQTLILVLTFLLNVYALTLLLNLYTHTLILNPLYTRELNQQGCVFHEPAQRCLGEGVQPNCDEIYSEDGCVSMKQCSFDSELHACHTRGSKPSCHFLREQNKCDVRDVRMDLWLM